jgi:rare lipoprotein A
MRRETERALWRRGFPGLLCAAVLFTVGGCREPTRVEEGVASYYADSLHGQPTASGETYNRRARSAAHPALPFGTRVKVTNLENGRSVWVHINDRGPHVEGRIIDLSAAAARRLGMKGDGTARVRLEIYE